jgi:hypothetical protein
LKEKSVSKLILQCPDFTKGLILTTDASSEGIGVVLSQVEIGKYLPISYASRNVNNADRNYSTSEKELLAIVWGIKHFRPCLYVRKFTIASDCKPLMNMNIKGPGSRLLRCRIKLAEYDYEIVYKKGALNTNADALSRIHGIALGYGTPSEAEIDEDTKK